MTPGTISLAAAEPTDLSDFRRELQAAFAVAVVDEFGKLPDGPIPSADDLEGSMGAPGAVVLRVMSEGRKVGGAVQPSTRRRTGTRSTSSS